MSEIYMKKLDKIFKNAHHLQIDDNSKIVIMSDCHRGAGNNDDNFVKNQNIYDSALQYYFNQGFTYIELGDGDEMWEVKNYNEIIEEHIDTFQELKKFHEAGRLIMIYGNHDMIKKNPAILEKYFYEYEDKIAKEKKKLLVNLKVYNALVLQYKGHNIFLIHGHQVDFMNNALWTISRFFVRYIWSHIELAGIKDPTSAAKNYRVTNKIEKKLQKWSEKNNKILIAGHTHRPLIPKSGDGLYFNDGSCVHPDGITCIEIQNGYISLVKWRFDVDDDKHIIVKRFILDNGEPIKNFFR